MAGQGFPHSRIFDKVGSSEVIKTHMERNKLIWLGLFVGGAIGGYIPSLWGGNMFSMSSVLLSALGSFLGIWLGFKLGE